MQLYDKQLLKHIIQLIPECIKILQNAYIFYIITYNISNFVWW